MMILIYDNVEQFKANKSLFKWHITNMCKNFPYIRIIFTSDTVIDYLKPDERCFQFELKALSP